MPIHTLPARLAIGMVALVLRGAWVRKEVACTAGQWNTVIFNYATGMPASWTLSFETPNGDPVGGTYREQRALWIIPQGAKTGPLAPEMVFSRYWINAFYSLEVRPDTDVIIRIS